MTGQKTIVAESSPHGFGGISVIRISGPRSKQIVTSTIKTKNQPFPSLKHRSLFKGKIVDREGFFVDDVVVSFFKKPNSFTGENVVEVSCHGNPSIVNKIISLFCDKGAQIASPGEFTKRAFLNGKMDLIQAEAVMSLIASKTSESAKANARLLNGELSFFFNKIKSSLIEVLSRIEFEMDISEEGFQPQLKNSTLKTLQEIQKDIKSALNSQSSFKIMCDGARVVFFGEPNTGKSTLLNSICGKERSITDNSPGTTRDSIEVPFSLSGTPITFVDTAGTRTTDNRVEKKGVARAKKEARQADLIIWVFSADKPYPSRIKKKTKKPTLYILNKTDLYNKKEKESLAKKNSDYLFVSAKNQTGINSLLDNIKETINPSLVNNISVSSSRQVAALNKIFTNTKRALGLIKNKKVVPYEFLAFEVKEAISFLDEVLGKTYTDDILNRVFSGFCVGK